jgi:hypothetical protein
MQGPTSQRTVSDAQGRVLVAKPAEAESGDRARVPDALLLLPANSRGEIDLLGKGELADECGCLLVSFGPARSARTPWGRVVRWGSLAVG